MTPMEFLNLLWQYKPEEQYILIWTLQDHRSYWFRDVAEAAEFVTTVKLDVYVGVGLSKTDFGPARRCASDNISGLAGFWSDLDLRSAAHGNKPLPGTLVDALSIIPPQFPPSIIIATGNGAHCWWLFKEPVVFDSEEERKDVVNLVQRWHSMLQLNSAARGWAYDKLADFARVLRIPGTQNLKDKENPKNVILHTLSDRRYNLSDFEEFLDDLGIPDQEAQERAARQWQDKFAHKPLVINTSARIPQQLLDSWTRDDMRFRNTWFRQRHDLKDQSQSGYDLALADFGIQAGLCEQQIVDLIIHHRELHRQKQRTRLDYFQRTVARAERRNMGETVKILTTPIPVPSAPAPATIEPAPAAETPAPDATTGTAAQQGAPVAPAEDAAPKQPTKVAHQKAILAQQISAALGIDIVRFVKFRGKEPVYHVILVSGDTVEFPSIGKLITQDSFRMALAASVNKIMRRIKPKDWDRIAQMMLDACFEEEGDVQQEFVGGAESLVASYLSESGFIDSMEGQKVQDQRKPTILRGQIAVNAMDLQGYINKTTYERLSVKAITSMLAAMGGRQERVRGKRFKEQSRWLLPVEKFDPIDYRGGANVGANVQ